MPLIGFQTVKTCSWNPIGLFWGDLECQTTTETILRPVFSQPVLAVTTIEELEDFVRENC